MATASPPPKTENDNANQHRIRAIGFPRSNDATNSGRANSELATKSAQKTLGQARPTPRPRPKGRLFIATLLLSIFGSFFYLLWNEFARYSAYGTVDGRVLTIAAPWSGIIEAIYIEDGQAVEEGQLLAKIDSADLQIRMAKLDDEIELAQAALHTREKELRSREQELAIDRLRSQSEHDQLLSQLHSERAKLEELRAQNTAISQLEYRGVVPNVEASQNTALFQGQKLRVRSLEEAIERYQAGLSALDNKALKVDDPTTETTRLKALVEERQRLAKYQLLGEIRAPASGRVLSIQHWKGEYVDSSTRLFEVLEERSLRAVLYIPQSQVAHFSPKQNLQLILPPNRQASEFTVERIDDQAVVAPGNLSRYFRKEEKLIAVIAEPKDAELRDTQGTKPIWLGAEVRMPHELSQLWSGISWLEPSSSGPASSSISPVAGN